jgi:6-phosphogluconolactonase
MTRYTLSGAGAQRARIERFPTADALMTGAAEHFVSDAAQAIRASGRFAVALSGGSTPRRLYEMLASPAYAGRVDWSRIHFFWGDERCVPPDDAASNYRMTRQALLDHVPVAEANVHRVRGEDVPAQGAAMYEQELRQAFATREGPPGLALGRRFDLVLLGLGDNGHTASLFPGLTAVREKQRWVVAEHVAEVSMWRVTLTPPVLNAAVHVAFLVSGAGKAAMLQRVLEGPSNPSVLPAQAIVPVEGVLDWLVDADAAARLRLESR